MDSKMTKLLDEIIHHEFEFTETQLALLVTELTRVIASYPGDRMNIDRVIVLRDTFANDVPHGLTPAYPSYAKG